MSPRTDRNKTVVLCLLALALVLPACGDGGPTNQDVEPLFVRVEPAALTLNAAARTQLRVVTGTGLVPAGATTRWESSNPTVVSVDQDGNVEALTQGEATITSTVSYKGNNGKGNSKVTVAPQEVSRVEVTPDLLPLATGASGQLVFTAFDAAGKAIAGATPKWSTSAPQIATVDASGLVTAKNRAGLANITAAYAGLSAGAIAAVGGAVPPSVGSVDVTPDYTAIVTGDSLLATAVVKDTADNVVEDPLVSWSSSNGKVAQVGANGLIKAVAAGTAVITAASGGKSADLSVAVSEPTAEVSFVVASPKQDTIRAIGFTKQLTATARDMQGNVIEGTTITWASLNTSVATVSNDGIVTAKLAGTALVAAAAAGCGSCAADTVTVHVVQEAASVALSPASLSLEVNGSGKLTATVKDAGGTVIPNAQVAWSAAPAGVVSVVSDGTVGGVATGTATVTASVNGKSEQATVTVSSGTVLPPPPSGSNGDLVVYPNENIAFILGPQVRPGSASSPWPWFDSNAETMGLKHGRAYPAQIVSDDGQSTLVPGDEAYNRNYYDVGMALYGQYYRTGNVEHLTNARKLTDAFYDFLLYEKAKYGGTAPRNMSFGGIILRAMDGRPDMWPHILEETRRQYNGWLGLRLDYPSIYLGVRDGAYALMYATWLAKVHPDAAVRAEMRQKALDAVQKYYLRLQDPDGGFYWMDPIVKDGKEKFAQPFMVGLLLEAFTYVHHLTGDAGIAAAFPRTVEWLHRYYRLTDPVPELPGIYWRNHPYFVWPDGTWDSAARLEGGWDTNTLREARQANSTILHAYGYAFKLTGDNRFRTWGDEVFAASFGKGNGPLADSYSNLADYQEKEFGQSYRSGARYLAWRIN
jgi:uncharacterized protein YjdB